MAYLHEIFSLLFPVILELSLSCLGMISFLWESFISDAQSTGGQIIAYTKSKLCCINLAFSRTRFLRNRCSDFNYF
jgi:hypothetical protein